MEEKKEERKEYKIYKIVCNETGEIYIGSTSRTLEERLQGHKILDCSSRQIIKRDNYYIEQIDSTFDEEESIILERYYIENNECVNKNIPGRTYKEYYKKNKDEISEKKKKWHEENKEKNNERTKKWHKKNKEKMSEYYKEYYKEYYEKYKEKYNKKSKEKYTCNCGSIITKVQKKRHEKSKKHQNFINSK